MNYVIYSLMVFILICIMLIWYVNIYNRFQSYIIRINEVENNIDSVLRKRFDLLNKSIGIIKACEAEKKEVLESIVKLRSRKISNFDLDRQLYEAINEFHLYKDSIPELKESESFMKIDLELQDSEIEITAFRKYYNDIITEYNRNIRTFPAIIVSKLCRYKEMPYFDGKDMYDDTINDFKL